MHLTCDVVPHSYKWLASTIIVVVFLSTVDKCNCKDKETLLATSQHELNNEYNVIIIAAIAFCHKEAEDD